MRIGLLEDDEDLVEVIGLWMDEKGDRLTAYSTGKSFRKGLASQKFDILVLDWYLPDTTGLKELDWVRGEMDLDIPIVFLTSRDDEESVVEALNHGADDYIIKPVKKEIMLARINALHRRNKLTDDVSKVGGNKDNKNNLQSQGVEVYEPYQIDYSQRCISVNGKDVKLTNKEFELAAFMFKHESSLISRDDLLEYIWGTRADLNTRTVDTHISRIRSKLSINTDAGWQLNSIYQCGYRLFRISTGC